MSEDGLLETVLYALVVPQRFHKERRALIVRAAVAVVWWYLTCLYLDPDQLPSTGQPEQPIATMLPAIRLDTSFTPGFKCDAQRPHCGTCQKQWAAQIAVPPPVGFAHPSEPTCTYDPIEGLVLAPDTVEDPNERVRLLEAQINQLQSKLVAAQQESDPTRAVSADPADHHQHQHQHQHHQHQHQHQHHQQQYHQSLSSSSRPYKSTSPPSANAHPPSASTSGSGLSPNGFSSTNLYTHPPQDSLHLGYAAGPSRNVPGPTLPPLNSLSSKEGGYVDNNNNGAGSSGGSGGGGYYATGLHSDVRSTSYPSVSDEVPADRSHGRTSSHPYHRDQPHISSLAKAERANSQYHASSHAHVRSTSDMDDPFTGVNDMNILSVSKLGRQTDHRSRGYSITNQPSPPFYDIMFSGWSRDLPPRQELIS
ncbi:hypothetical protein FRC20_001601 [Serendipita sp. 405]|nr:hypothetical protein FRC20_001601 [Serendipita sp. 405]